MFHHKHMHAKRIALLLMSFSSAGSLLGADEVAALSQGGIFLTGQSSGRSSFSTRFSGLSNKISEGFDTFSKGFSRCLSKSKLKWNSLTPKTKFGIKLGTAVAGTFGLGAVATYLYKLRQAPARGETGLRLREIADRLQADSLQQVPSAEDIDIQRRRLLLLEGAPEAEQIEKDLESVFYFIRTSQPVVANVLLRNARQKIDEAWIRRQQEAARNHIDSDARANFVHQDQEMPGDDAQLERDHIARARAVAAREREEAELQRLAAEAHCARVVAERARHVETTDQAPANATNAFEVLSAQTGRSTASGSTGSEVGSSTVIHESALTGSEEILSIIDRQQQRAKDYLRMHAREKSRRRRTLNADEYYSFLLSSVPAQDFLAGLESVRILMRESRLDEAQQVLRGLREKYPENNDLEILDHSIYTLSELQKGRSLENAPAPSSSSSAATSAINPEDLSHMPVDADDLQPDEDAPQALELDNEEDAALNADESEGFHADEVDLDSALAMFTSLPASSESSATSPNDLTQNEQPEEDQADEDLMQDPLHLLNNYYLLFNGNEEGAAPAASSVEPVSSEVASSSDAASSEVSLPEITHAVLADDMRELTNDLVSQALDALPASSNANVAEEKELQEIVVPGVTESPVTRAASADLVHTPRRSTGRKAASPASPIRRVQPITIADEVLVPKHERFQGQGDDFVKQGSPKRKSQGRNSPNRKRPQIFEA